MEGHGAYRDYCCITELFPGEPIRPNKWIQNNTVADSVIKMHRITSAIGKPGSSFPYCKAICIVVKSNLSICEHAVMHDYIHTMGVMLGNPRSCNSKFVSSEEQCMPCSYVHDGYRSWVQLNGAMEKPQHGNASKQRGNPSKTVFLWCFRNFCKKNRDPSKPSFWGVSSLLWGVS